MDFNAEDVKLDQELNQAIHALRQESRAILAKLRFPNELRGMVTGAGAGFALTGPVGAFLFGSLGYLLGKAYKLEDPEKKVLLGHYNQKMAQLKGLTGGGRPNPGGGGPIPSGGTMSAGDLAKLEIEGFGFDGAFFDLFGYPSKPFHCIVFGKPKQGKSIFSFQFADYLAEFGKVLYIACEEGFGGTLQKKITDFGLQDNKNVHFSDARTLQEIQKVVPGYDFVVIDSVNFADLEVKDVEDLKSQNPQTSFVTIHQATKGGDMRGSQEYRHNCDMVVEVIQGIAYQEGRFQAPGSYDIFDGKGKSQEDPKKKEEEQGAQAEQLEMFNAEDLY